MTNDKAKKRTCFSAFRQAVSKVSGAGDVYLANQAQDLHEKGDLTGAVKLYARALEIEPQFPEAEYQSAVAELGLGKTTDAEKAFRRALALREDWTLPMTALGSLLVQEGQNDEAEKLLSRVIELEPQNSGALSALVEFRLKTKAAAPVLQDLNLGNVSLIVTFLSVVAWRFVDRPLAQFVVRQLGDESCASAKLGDGHRHIRLGPSEIHMQGGSLSEALMPGGGQAEHQFTERDDERHGCGKMSG